MKETAYSTAVRELPPEERPRERLARLGPEALRDAELLAILFRTGTRDVGAVALAERAVRHFSDLRGLARASVDELQQVKGLGQVKAVEVKAALELGKRLAVHTDPGRPRIRSAEDVATWFKPQEWNEMSVSAHGRRVVVHVNGRKTAELENDKGRLKGRLGLQLHGGQEMHVMFKNIEILLPKKK